MAEMKEPFIQQRNLCEWQDVLGELRAEACVDFLAAEVLAPVPAHLICCLFYDVGVCLGEANTRFVFLFVLEVYLLQPGAEALFLLVFRDK